MSRDGEQRGHILGTDALSGEVTLDPGPSSGVCNLLQRLAGDAG